MYTVCFAPYNGGADENAESGSGGLYCSNTSLPVPANAAVLQLPSCGVAHQSQCTLSCKEGFTGDNITYMCNVTSENSTMAHEWTIINGTLSDPHCKISMSSYHITL